MAVVNMPHILMRNVSPLLSDNGFGWNDKTWGKETKNILSVRPGHLSSDVTIKCETKNRILVVIVIFDVSPFQK